MEMIKKNTAYWIAFVWYMIGGFFGANFWLTLVSGVIVSILFNMFSTKVNFTDDNTESDKDDKGEKE